ncbi:MAG: HAMP domain-containing histidine kinase [Lachnospiraceae bacterium]|nr:HAMP domain-containing histidine kinase [Lachnospiraceae bacterium]
MEQKQQLRELQFFLIKKFILTLIVVSIAESGVTRFLNNSVLPLMMQVFFNNMDADELRMGGIAAICLAIAASFLAGLMKLLLPGRAQQLAASALASLTGIVDNRISPENSLAFDTMSPYMRFLLLMFFIFILVIMLIPFFVGGVYYIGVVIRQFKKIEKTQNEKRLEYEKKRNLMLSDIAHDLRTPITTVNGYARALSDGMVPEDKKQEYLDRIMAKSERINDLITYLFDYVKTDSEGFELHKEKTDVCELLRKCVALHYEDMEDAGMEPEVIIPEEPVYLMLDRLQFSRTVTNLIVNAVRHNREGTSIAVAMDREDDKIRICIADNGDRIEEKMAEHIFEPFITGDESRNSRGGTGLGLSIAKKIMQLHGFDLMLLQQPALKDDPLVGGYEKAFITVIRNAG